MYEHTNVLSIEYNPRTPVATSRTDVIQLQPNHYNDAYEAPIKSFSIRCVRCVRNTVVHAPGQGEEITFEYNNTDGQKLFSAAEL